MTQSHEPAIKLAEKLNEMLGDDYKIIYSNSGSDANEVAFKIARQYHQQNGEPSRYKFISRYRAYHGSSMGALAATGQALRKYKYEPLAPGFLHVAPPDNYRRPEGNRLKITIFNGHKNLKRKSFGNRKKRLLELLWNHSLQGAAFLVPHPFILKKFKKFVTDTVYFLIVDEVICGFGRTGKAFGHQHFNLKPDIITMAKGLTSAYLPLSVTAVRKDIYDKFDTGEENSHLRHVNTFGGNPAACAVALKNLEIMENENLFERSAELGERLLKELAHLKDHPFVGDIRGLGFLLGIELVENKETKEPATNARVAKIIGECKANGLIIGRNGDTVAGFNNIIALSPPLSCTDEDFDFIVAVMKKVFKENN